MDLNSIFGKPNVPTKDELYIKDIVTEYIKSPKVKKEVTPTSGKYYISNFEDNIFILLGDNTVQITNHSFFYKKTFSMPFLDRLKKIVATKIEEEKKEFNKAVFSNEIDLLRGIFKTVANG